MQTKAKRFFIIDVLLIIAILVFILAIKTPEDADGLKIENMTFNTVALSWDKSQNASGYHVYRSADGKKFKYVSSTSDTEYVDTDLATGTTYTYKVCPYNGIKKSDGDTIKATPELDTPKIKGTVENGKVALSIEKVDGAQGYRIFRDNKEIDTVSEKTDIDTADKTEAKKETEKDELLYIDKNAKSDTDYTYEVKAYREAAESKASNTVNLALVSAGTISIKPSGTDFTLSWESDYADYKLYQDDELLTETTDKSYTIPAKEGTYNFKLVGYNDDVQSPETIQTFKVSEVPMDNTGAIDAAVDWAVNIANDDSFTYGTGKRAHHFGCYFCGNNLRIKGSSEVDGHSYEKTYCCNPFISAAYAHGAGDKALLKACKAGHGIGMSEKDYTRYGNWENVGKPAYEDLQKGDVLVKQRHVAMYIGDGEYVQAESEGWDADSIAVSELSQKKYDSFKFIMRYTGTGSGTMFEAVEITPKEE